MLKNKKGTYMIPSNENNSTRTVTSWNDTAIYAKGNFAILTTFLRALTLSIINRDYIETWDENVNGEVIRYSMSRLEVINNFGRVLFDKVVHHKALPNSTPPSEEKAIVTEEDPFAYLLPLFPDSPSDNAPPKTTLPIEDGNSFYLYDFCKDGSEESKDTRKHLTLGAQETQPTHNNGIGPSDEDFLNALTDYAEGSRKETPKEMKGNEAADLLELFSL